MLAGSFIASVFVIAADRPFLDAGEVVVGAIAALPHAEHQWRIGLLLVLESHYELFEFDERALGLKIRIAILEVEEPDVAGRGAAFEPHISQFCERSAGRNVAK